MSDYISKQDAIAVAESYQVERTGFHLNDYEYGRNQVADSIASDLEDIEPADVVPVLHSHWTLVGWHKGMKVVECFRCKYRAIGSGNFCPNCGAKMDEGE